MAENFLERTAYTGSIEDLTTEVRLQYEIGDLQQATVIAVGYEDCNVKLTTDTGDYNMKVFAKTRSLQDIERYVDVMERVLAAGIRHPRLVDNKQGSPMSRLSGKVPFVVLEYVDGQTYYDRDAVPTNAELQAIAAESVKLHAMDYKPSYVVDSWAVQGIDAMYELVCAHLSPEDEILVQEAMRRFGMSDSARLSHAFVHGDIIKTNVVVDKNDRPYIIDFSVSNWYPKIQELAVIASSLLYDSKKYVPLGERVESIINAYKNSGGELTDYDVAQIYDYALATNAMELLGSHREIFVNGDDSEESRHWLELGRANLRNELT